MSQNIVCARIDLDDFIPRFEKLFVDITEYLQGDYDLNDTEDLLLVCSVFLEFFYLADSKYQGMSRSVVDLLKIMSDMDNESPKAESVLH